MKKFVALLAAFLVCFISVYPISGGAWGLEDLDPENMALLGSNNSTLYVNYAFTDTYLTDEYSAGSWPSELHFAFAGTRSNYEVYKLPVSCPSERGFIALASIPKNIDGLDVTRARLYVRSNQIGLYSYLEIDFISGNILTHQSAVAIGRVFYDDFSGIVLEESENLLGIALSGTLKLDTKEIALVLYFDETSNSSFSMNFDIDNNQYEPLNCYYTLSSVVEPEVDTVTVSLASSAPYYPGTSIQLDADVSGIGIAPGTPQSTVYWYVHGNTSADTYIDNNGLLTIANDETATALEIEAVSTYDATKSDSVTIPVSYPLLGSMVAPSGTQTFVESSKRQELQFELILPNGEPFNYTDIEWTIQPSVGASSYFRIDDQGLLVVEPNAPAGSSCTVHFAYGFDTDNVSAAGATVKIVSTQEGIYDNLNPTPEQSDKAEEMEDAIGDAADKLENNNSSLGQLTPTRPQINTNLEFDQDQMLAVSPLVTNIWSINGLGRMISIVLVVATVAYIFFGKRDG